MNIPWKVNYETRRTELQFNLWKVPYKRKTEGAQTY